MNRFLCSTLLFISATFAYGSNHDLPRDCRGPGFLKNHWVVFSGSIERQGVAAPVDRSSAIERAPASLDTARSSTNEDLVKDALVLIEATPGFIVKDIQETTHFSSVVFSFVPEDFPNPTLATEQKLSLLSKLESLPDATLGCVEERK